MKRLFKLAQQMENSESFEEFNDADFDDAFVENSKTAKQTNRKLYAIAKRLQKGFGK